MNSREWKPDDMVCHGCVGSPGLKSQIKRDGRTAICSGCSKRRKAVTVEHLAEIISEVYREYVRPVESGGSSPAEIIADWIQDDDTGLPDSVVGILNEAEWPDITDGADPEFETSGSYAMADRVTYPYELIESWHQFAERLKYSRRFETEHPWRFLEELLEAMQDLSGGKCVLDLAPGARIYRARLAETPEAATAILNEVPMSLSAPPRNSRIAGRMNSPGIATLYAAFDQETCITEVRPWVGSYVVIAQLETLAPLRLLDLTWFIREGFAGDIFDPYYRWQAEYLTFLRGFNRLVSRPVQAGQSLLEYIPTQVAAEYFASVGKFDGMIYTSATTPLNLDDEDDKVGHNVALFDGSGILRIPTSEPDPVEPTDRTAPHRIPIFVPSPDISRLPVEEREPVLALVPNSHHAIRILGVRVEHERAFLWSRNSTSPHDYFTDEW